MIPSNSPSTWEFLYSVFIALWGLERRPGKYKYMKTQAIKISHTVASSLASIHFLLPMGFLIFSAVIKIDCIGHVVNLVPAFI